MNDLTNMTRENITFGFWVYLMSDCVLFAGLFATYAVMHGATLGGPTPHELFSLPFVLVETLLLLTSSFTVGLALLATHLSKKVWVLGALAATLLLGWGFLGLELNEFARLIADGNGPQANAFLSSYFALVGTHGLHVALGSVWMLVAGAHVLLRGTEASARKVALVALFWHFLDVVWIFIFTFVYLFGYLGF